MLRHDAILRMRSAWWVKDRSVRQIFSMLDGPAGQTRAVGGIVRDTILGRTNVDGDLDMATELLPKEVVKRARAAGMQSYPTGIDYGTVTIRNGKIVAEVTTLRKDVKTDGRHAVVEFGTNWGVDARRRDFTMNALYAAPSGALYDPLDGLDDLLNGRVRFIGDPDQRIAEDRLRVYRFFRFCASHGGESCAGEGMLACKRAAHDLGDLAAERVGAEIVKMMGLPRVAATFANMRKVGILDFNVAALQALARYEDKTGSPVVAARLAVLMDFIDMGRMKEEWRLSGAVVREAQEVRRMAQLMIEDSLYEAAYRHGRFAYVAMPVASTLADWSVEKMQDVRSFWDQMVVPAFPVDGEDLLDAGFAQGPELGKALRRVEADWVGSGFNLTRDDLLEKLGSYLGSNLNP